MLNCEYKKREYWDERYEEEESFEWFKSYAELKPLLSPHIRADDRVLVLGCGNSPFSRDLYEDGVTRVTNVDYSPVCIANMAAKNADCDDMEWLTMDICELEFEDGSFDAVIEKGTLDALLAGEEDVWRLSRAGHRFVERSLAHVSRVLRPGGRFLSVTFAQPHFRRPLYARACFDWSVCACALPSRGCFEYFVYVMTKGEVLTESDRSLEEESSRKRRQRSEEASEPIAFFSEEDRSDYLFSIDT